MLRWIAKAVVTSSVVIGLIFLMAGATLAISAARTGWYVLGSGLGTVSQTASHMKDGMTDAQTENDKQAAADAKAAAPKKKP
jgi:hypothetical protein